MKLRELIESLQLLEDYWMDIPVVDEWTDEINCILCKSEYIQLTNVQPIEKALVGIPTLKSK